jgi:hypothetical protein
MNLDLTTPPTAQEIAYGGEFKANFNKKKIDNSSASEEALQLAVISWIRCAYPELITHSSYLQGNVNNVGLSQKANLMGYTSGFPDVFIYATKGGYGGLFLELKNGKKGVISIRQKEIIEALQIAGYYGGVIRTLEEAKTMINYYMNL